MAINNVNPTSTNGPAVNTITPGAPRTVKNNENGGPTSTGKGGLKSTLRIKNANIQMGSTTDVTLRNKNPQGEKVNNLF